MPSSRSVARTVTGLTRNRHLLATGAGAAVASLIGVAAATTGPPISLAAAHGPAESSVGAISPALHVAAASTAPKSRGSVRTASPQIASAPVQQAQSSGSARAPSPQVTSAADQQAQSGGSAPAASPQPYQIYDSVTPSAIPVSSQAIALYADGNYAASPSQAGHRGLVLWIDTSGSDPNADVLDVEPGDATPTQAATWVAQKLDASPNSVAIVYTMESEWPAVQAAINALPWWMPSHTRYWIADPTGVPHVVPGSQATQWYWGQNYDISTALPNF
jgi:hypothetical protein